MKTSQIDSADNQRLKTIRGLVRSGRRKEILDEQELILLEGEKLIQEALNKDIKLKDIVLSQSYYQDNFQKSRLADILEAIYIVNDTIFKSLYSTDTSCGIVATALPKQYTMHEIITSSKLILLADTIQDPGNLGTIIRTALAFGAGGIILSKGSIDCYNPKVIRSSMGAIFNLPVINNTDLLSVIEKIKKNNFLVMALDNNAKHSIWEYEWSKKPVAVILGNEGHGISKDVLKMADSSAFIPISSDCESLNVAIATGIILAFSKSPWGN